MENKNTFFAGMGNSRDLKAIVMVLLISLVVGGYLYVAKDKTLIEQKGISRQRKDIEKAVEIQSRKYIPYVLAACDKYKNIYNVDPLLVFSVMKNESKFNEDAVSYVGAAGLMQIMPEVIDPRSGVFVYRPEYYETAKKDRAKALKYREKAIHLFNENDFEQARKYKILSNQFMKKANILFEKYKLMLERFRDTDKRFDPQFSIDLGVKIMAMDLRAREGDIREAAAAYNAGPNSVRRFEGIPPINETVLFQNKVRNGYEDYLEKLAAGR